MIVENRNYRHTDGRQLRILREADRGVYVITRIGHAGYASVISSGRYRRGAGAGAGAGDLARAHAIAVSQGYQEETLP